VREYAGKGCRSAGREHPACGPNRQRTGRWRISRSFIESRRGLSRRRRSDRRLGAANAGRNYGFSIWGQGRAIAIRHWPRGSAGHLVSPRLLRNEFYPLNFRNVDHHTLSPHRCFEAVRVKPAWRLNDKLTGRGIRRPLCGPAK